MKALTRSLACLERERKMRLCVQGISVRFLEISFAVQTDLRSSTCQFERRECTCNTPAPTADNASSSLYGSAYRSDGTLWVMCVSVCFMHVLLCVCLPKPCVFCLNFSLLLGRHIHIFILLTWVVPAEGVAHRSSSESSAPQPVGADDAPLLAVLAAGHAAHSVCAAHAPRLAAAHAVCAAAAPGCLALTDHRWPLESQAVTAEPKLRLYGCLHCLLQLHAHCLCCFLTQGWAVQKG